MSGHEQLLREAHGLAQENLKRGGRPFGAVLAIGGEIILPLTPPPIPLTRLDIGLSAAQLYGRWRST